MLNWTVDERYSAVADQRTTYRIFSSEHEKYIVVQVTINAGGNSLSSNIGEFESLKEALDAAESHAAKRPPPEEMEGDGRTFTAEDIINRNR